jgi:hypothetical protein
MVFIERRYETYTGINSHNITIYHYQFVFASTGFGDRMILRDIFFETLELCTIIAFDVRRIVVDGLASTPFL